MEGTQSRITAKDLGFLCLTLEVCVPKLKIPKLPSHRAGHRGKKRPNNEPWSPNLFLSTILGAMGFSGMNSSVFGSLGRVDIVSGSSRVVDSSARGANEGHLRHLSA